MAEKLAYLVALVTKFRLCDHFCLHISRHHNMFSNNDLLQRKWTL